MRDDHHVTYRHERSIANAAEKVRRAFGVSNAARFDIVELFERLTKHDILGKGFLEIVFFDMKPGEKPARVTFRPLVLHIDREVWSFAKLGDSFSRFVLAHELGHIILHDHNAKAFSEDPKLQIRFSEKEHSAEWQASTFAGHFLLPDQIVRSLGDVKRAVEHCDVLEKMAIGRFGAVKRLRKGSDQEGDLCEKCGNFSLHREGLSLSCDTCPHSEEG